MLRGARIFSARRAALGARCGARGPLGGRLALCACGGVRGRWPAVRSNPPVASSAAPHATGRLARMPHACHARMSRGPSDGPRAADRRRLASGTRYTWDTPRHYSAKLSLTHPKPCGQYVAQHQYLARVEAADSLC
eukprot:6645997-Prymnesium_polylepis.1